MPGRPRAPPRPHPSGSVWRRGPPRRRDDARGRRPAPPRSSGEAALAACGPGFARRPRGRRARRGSVRCARGGEAGAARGLIPVGRPNSRCSVGLQDLVPGVGSALRADREAGRLVFLPCPHRPARRRHLRPGGRKSILMNRHPPLSVVT